jgi:hypothetical protein
MGGLVVHHVRFTVEAQTPIELGPQAGAQLRGALYNALIAQACTAPGGHHDPAQADWCPVCRLMAREDPTAVRGKDVPRAFAIQPPLDEARRYASGQRLVFGLSLFGDAIAVFPYIVLALPTMGHKGVGYGRGRFVLRRVEACNPLTGATELLMGEGPRRVRQPTLSVTPEQVSAAATQLPADRLALNFLTPTRLTEGQALVKRPVFRPLIARLLERFDTLNREYGQAESASPWQELTTLANAIRVTEDDTQWVEVHSGSRRRGDTTPISGFVGKVTYEGGLAPFREWLLWGQSIQVGKNAVKGDGLYEIMRSY